MDKKAKSFLARKLLMAAVVAIVMASCQTAPMYEGAQTGSNTSLEETIVAGSRASRQSRARILASVSSADSYNYVEAKSLNDTFIFGSFQPGEEIWIIAQYIDDNEQQSADDPGSGAMVVNLPGQIDERTGFQKQIPLPLKHTDVNAVINGYIGIVNVVQKFENPFNEKIEAVYLFPLPEKAAVTEFVMVIGERRIRGILREKEQAQAIYNQARSQGYQASLLVQHRPNVFEQKVANIEPGNTIDVEIRYFHTLAYTDGWYSFVFPTVVGPRYNPPGSRDGIGAVSSETVRPIKQQTSVRYLRPAERSGHDISIRVEVHAGVEIEELQSSHAIETTRVTPRSTKVKLVGGSTIPNKDFILNFRVAGEHVKSSLLTWTDPVTSQAYFTMMMYPPENVTALDRRPMELVFVLDCSGSMAGTPLRQAKNAVLSALNHLQIEDTFQIIRFSDNASQFGSTPVPATPTNLSKARRYIKQLNGTGGTRMIEGIRSALRFPHDRSRLRFVTFLTDGYIGNEADIIAAVHDEIGESRIFSFGVGSSVNRYLLERMAAAGQGAVAYLGPRDSGKRIMSEFFARISHPAMTDLEFNWGGMSVTDVYPSQIPDLFVGRPLVVTGKFSGTADRVVVSGFTGYERQNVVISNSADVGSNQSIAKIWARLRIANLADRQTWEYDPHGELEYAIRETALEYSLMSKYTSFVAVDASHITYGEHGTTVYQPVPVPQGVKYETTVNKN